MVELKLDKTLLRPGMRLAVGLSGGADSVALARRLAAEAGELGLMLSVAHLHHGLRGAEADGDQQFCRELAAGLGLPFQTSMVDTVAEAGRQGESIEEAARRLRYGWFRELIASHGLDAVATAHTLDDQAETVVGKLLRGAWTEGLSGIYPAVHFPEGQIVRPILAVRRSEVEAYLAGLGQAWREDRSNAELVYTRNRIRHELLPVLDGWNPQLREHLGNMAELARDEESYWQAEMERLGAQLILEGRPVRGGGRAAGLCEGLALDVVRVAALGPAVQRRLLRYAAGRLGVALNFDATETLRRLATEGRAGQKATLPGPLLAERTPRELRLSPNFAAAEAVAAEVTLPVPGEAEGYGFRFRAEAEGAWPAAVIRAWKPGDRVMLRYSSGPRKVKEVLERMKVSGTDRAGWPVVVWQGEVVWMRGVAVEIQGGLRLTVEAQAGA